MLSFCGVFHCHFNYYPDIHTIMWIQMLTPNWLKITERIENKLLSLTYKVLTTTQPSYLHNLITVQPLRNTRSSSLQHYALGHISLSMFRALRVCWTHW